MNAQQATREHVLALTRDFISQPRLSEYFIVVKSSAYAKSAFKNNKK